jgi:Mn2+/Fe2+ NRAMP family transporter
LEGLNDRVIGCVEMLRRVLVLRGITASNVPANHALTQVNPAITSFQAILTAIRARRDLSYLMKMITLLCHVSLPFIALVLLKIVKPKSRRTNKFQRVRSAFTLNLESVTSLSYRQTKLFILLASPLE